LARAKQDEEKDEADKPMTYDERWPELFFWLRFFPRGASNRVLESGVG